MRVYLAGAWSRKAEIRGVAERVNQIPGVRVVARWLTDAQDSSPSGGTQWAERRRRAIMDVQDVQGCDVLVRFTDDLTSDVVPARLASGARMFEMGYAFRDGKMIIVVGGFQQVFDALPGIIHVEDVDKLLDMLGSMVAQEER